VGFTYYQNFTNTNQAMNYRYLGNSGLKVSELCLGTMTFGDASYGAEIGTVSEPGAGRLTAIALDHGINFFDTADVYSGGLSEIILGKALGNRRKDVVVASKVRFAMSNRPNDTGLSRSHIIESCENSLKRLGTDVIDLYQIHSYDPGTPLQETLRALHELVQSGKVRYIGCSNLTAWQTMKALAVSEKLNLDQFVSAQLYYSVGARDIEHELVPLCLDQGLGILCWSPLSGGFFSGKYFKEVNSPDDSRRSFKDAGSLKYWPTDEAKGYLIVEELDRKAIKHNKTIAQVALNWLLRKPAVTSVIIGTRKESQLTENLGASGWELTAEDVEKLDEISQPVVPYPVWHQNYSDNR
jgi:aryl-alcohol dehydrogenase-like predicted oxidoreductase